MLDEYLKSVRFLTQQLAQPFEGKTVVVTHHAPTAASLRERFEGESVHIRAAYASNLEHLMGGDVVPLWVHGHTHNTVDVQISGTCAGQITLASPVSTSDSDSDTGSRLPFPGNREKEARCEGCDRTG